MVVGYMAQNSTGYGIHIISHSSDLLIKIGCKIRELEGIDTFSSM